MKIAVFLAALTIGLSFTIGAVASKYGTSVSTRFLETGKYDLAALDSFAKNDQTNAKGYVFPVLFPGDILYMICLAGFLGFASVACVDAAASIQFLKNVPRWVFVIAPALFLASDLTEDILLARLLTWPENINPESVQQAKLVTTCKIGLCTVAIVQTIALSAIAAWDRGTTET